MYEDLITRSSIILLYNYLERWTLVSCTILRSKYNRVLVWNC